MNNGHYFKVEVFMYVNAEDSAHACRTVIDVMREHGVENYSIHDAVDECSVENCSEVTS